MSKIDASIIIVHYRVLKQTERCLKSIYSSKLKRPFEIIVVDNSISAAEKAFKLKNNFPQISYLKSPGNLGYGAGNNLGAKLAKGEYLFILNPDTEVKPRSLDKLISFLDKNRAAGAVGPNLVDPKGRLFPLQGTRALTPLRAIFSLSLIDKIFPKNPISRVYWMKDVKKISRREVDVVPGSAFMIRKEVFEKLQGFDEKFFLYFEESDLCKRIKESGYKIFMIPEAKVIHYWEPAEKGEHLNKFFVKSRFYYFKKHYGIFWAVLIEAITRVSKWSVFLGGIMIMATFLRLWKLKDSMVFIGDFGWYYLQAKGMLLDRNIPLVGIPSSVPVLRQGAIWTWMLAAALLLGKFNPVSGALLSVFLGLLGVFGIYFIGSLWFDKKVGMISALLAATSPSIVSFDRLPFITSGIFPITILVSLSLTKIIKGFERYWFFLGFWLAILFQFELASFVMFPIILGTLLWVKVKVRSKNLLNFFGGGFIGLLPFIFWDIKEGTYIQTVGFLVWLLTKVYESFGEFVFFGILGLLLFYKFSKRFDSFPKKFLGFWLVTGISAFILRGIFSQAYWPIVFLPVILVYSLFFNWVIKKGSRLGWGFLVLFIIFNFLYFREYSDKAGEEIGLTERNEVTKFIVNDTKGKDYSLRYIGPGYNFHSGDNHWRYLLWWKGNEPKNSEALIYTVAENPYELVGEFERKYNFGKVMVGVKEND